MKFVHVVAIAGLLAAVPAFGQTQAVPSVSKGAAPRSVASGAVHATKGVVKSVDGATLVITKTASRGPETTFVLNGATQKQGDIVVGASVDVRYHVDGKSRVATAVSVQSAKAGARGTGR